MRRIIAPIHPARERMLLGLGVAAIVGGLAGCASLGRCGVEGCPEDRRVTAEVRALLDEHTELGTPNVVRVQTVDGVVYLKGLVSTPYQKRLAEALARQAGGGARVVNTIGVDNGAR
jgi:osmotically-inducible protein OsmY